MARNQIFLINERQISPNQQIWLRQYFSPKLKKTYHADHLSTLELIWLSFKE